MTEDSPDRSEAVRFILDRIDSVPHLEAVLLLWRQPSEPWTVERVAKRLWIEGKDARSILQDLVRENLIRPLAGEQGQELYEADRRNDRIFQAVADAYREEMVRISRMIHAKPSSSVRAFARAFRFTKEQE